MYNKVIMMGRLVSDPELKTTPQGVNVCSFRIADRISFTGEKSQGGGAYSDYAASVSSAAPAAPAAPAPAAPQSPTSDFSSAASDDDYPF